jgi:hypothetical protein
MACWLVKRMSKTGVAKLLGTTCVLAEIAEALTAPMLRPGGTAFRARSV